MKAELIREYEKRKLVFVDEKVQAEGELDFINHQMKVIEEALENCSQIIKKEKENMIYHQEHLSFKSPIEIELSLETIKQTQETLLTFGELAFSFQSNIESGLANVKRAEKGIALCDDCLEKLQPLEGNEHEDLFNEIKEILQDT